MLSSLSLQARIGNITLIFPSSDSPLSSEMVMKGTASTTLHALLASGEDQSIVFFGAQGPGKTASASALLHSLLLHDPTHPATGPLRACQVLTPFTVTHDNSAQCLVATEIAYVEELREGGVREGGVRVGGVRFVTCALDTSQLMEMAVVRCADSDLCEQMSALGVDWEMVQWIRDALSVVRGLCGGGVGGEGVKGVGALGVEEVEFERLSAEEKVQLAGLVYEHILEWLGKWGGGRRERERGGGEEGEERWGRRGGGGEVEGGGDGVISVSVLASEVAPTRPNSCGCQ